jgi:hypothetical protein
MFEGFMFYVVCFAILAVVIILMIGIGGFGQGGAFNAKHGNRMMRYRLIAQAVAVALILLAIYLRKDGG